ncbi:MAG: SGNH/GDSL hydrolase family protein [Clostridia bacterium]|nr:SGNH/GDSL hydrolase family protein [Clostridia bacterium]
MKKSSAALITSLLVGAAVVIAACSAPGDKNGESNATAADTAAAGGGKADLVLDFNLDTICTSSFHALGIGAEAKDGAWVSTDHIMLGSCYGLSYSLAGCRGYLSVAFYGKDGSFISGVGTESTVMPATAVQGFVVCPENAVSVRFLNFTGRGDLGAYPTPSVTVYATEAEYRTATALPLFGKKIVCIGDSLTEGDYGCEMPCVPNRHFAGYPYYLARQTGAECVNYGVCGATSTSYLSIYAQNAAVAVKDADIVLLMLGTNRGLEAGTELYNDYITLVTSVQADMKDGAQLYLITPPSTTIDAEKTGFGSFNNIITAYNSVKEIGARLGLSVIDAFRHSPIQPAVEDLYQSEDGVHMNGAGYEAFAAYLAREIGAEPIRELI